MRSKQFPFLFIVLTIIVLLLQGGDYRSAQASSPVFMSGIFTTVWGDTQLGSDESRIIYFLSTIKYGNIQLFIDERLLTSKGGPIALNNKTINIQGRWQVVGKSLVVQALTLATSEMEDPDGIYGSQPWVSILCKFADIDDEPNNLPYFQGMYSADYPGLDHYWQQQSYELVNLEGSGAFGWYVLPHPRDYYLPGGNLDWWKAAEECTAAADTYVDFSAYVGINLMFNAVLDCCAWGGGWNACLDDTCQVWRMTWEPPWGYQNIGVIAHETGHGFGLPHSLGNCQLGYDNRWDVMSSLWENNPPDPIYGTMGQHTISYHKQLGGWITFEQIYTATPRTIRTIILERIAVPQTENYLESRILINGSVNYFYTLEVRKKAIDPISYDKFLPGSAVIIHEVEVTRPEAAILINPNGICDTSDEGAMWKPGEVFADIPHGISVSIDSATESGYVVTINNQFTQMEDVVINGVESGNIGESIPFTATISPNDATTPITYTWEATGLSPVVHVGETVDAIDFTWDEIGTQAITVTASNDGGTVVDTWSIMVYFKMYLPVGLRD